MNTHKFIRLSLFIPIAIGISSSLIALFIGCGGGGQKGTAGGADTLRQSCINNINAIENKMKTLANPDPYTYNLAITAYNKFSSNFPQDSLSPVCLYKAAQMAMSLNQYQRAMSILDTLTAKYSTFRRLPDCVFLQAYIYDDKIKDTAKARAKYQEVITRFPQSTYSEQAKGAIALLGKSYDEIMKEFDERNKEKSSKAI